MITSPKPSESLAEKKPHNISSNREILAQNSHNAVESLVVQQTNNNVQNTNQIKDNITVSKPLATYIEPVGALQPIPSRDIQRNDNSVEQKDQGKANVTLSKPLASSNVEAGEQHSIPSSATRPERPNEEKSSGAQAAPELRKVAPQQTVAEPPRKPENKEGQAALALEKINAVQQALKLQKSAATPAKQALEDIVHVTPKNANSQTMPDQVIAVSLPKLKQSIVKDDGSPKIATVRRAAERFERHTALMNSKSVSDLTRMSNVRTRSKSIGDALRTRFAEDQAPEKGGVLPWTGKPQGNKGYALQMSKSSDSITAAKMLAKARAEAENAGRWRINQNLSKSIEQQIGVYSKTKDEIRKILNLAKTGSINDRVALFERMKDLEPEPIDPDEKAEAIRMEIINARAQAQPEVESDSDTESEIQTPIESKVRPLKIPMIQKPMDKPSVMSSPATSLRINQSNGSQDSPKRERRPSVEDLPCVKTKIQTYTAAAAEETKVEEPKEEIRPKPILKNDKERSRSPRKTNKPRLVSEHYLAPQQSMQIYHQSATDMSEDESEISMRERKESETKTSQVLSRKKSLSVVVNDKPDPGPILLKVPPKPSAEARPGIMKSKSFAASSGQYECSVNESAGKKLQMMSFFGQGNSQQQQQKTVRIKEKPNKSSSITSITDEIMAEEDLIDIDAEFDALLNKTFEKESRRLATSSSQPEPHQATEKAAGRGAGGQRRGRGTVSLDMSTAPPNVQRNIRELRKSTSFGSSSGLARAARDELVIEDRKAVGMNPLPVIRQKNFDPVGALPSSAGRREGHSPSPTLSEYDTCDDPWDDY